MAGIRSDAIAAATGSERVVRAMPNTPALIGQGIAGLYARAGGRPTAERAASTPCSRPTGELVWVEREAQLDAVTALSGLRARPTCSMCSRRCRGRPRDGPAADDAARRLAVQTVAGAAALAAASPSRSAELRRSVTSPGGTTAGGDRPCSTTRGVRATRVRASAVRRSPRQRAAARGARRASSAPLPDVAPCDARTGRR